MPTDETKKPAKRSGSADKPSKPAAKKTSPAKSSAKKKPAEKAAVKKTTPLAEKTVPLAAKETMPAAKEAPKLEQPAAAVSEASAPFQAEVKTPFKKKYLPLAALAVLALCAGLWFAFAGNSNDTVLFTYKDDAGKQISVTIGEAMKEIRPLLAQAPQEEIDALQEGIEGLRNVITAVNVQPRILLLESLKISNFRDTEMYQNQLSNSLGILPYSLAFNKALEEINKAVDTEKITIAEISRISLKKIGTPEADGAARTQADEILAQLKASTNTNITEEFGRLATEKSQEPMGVQSGGYFGSIAKGDYPTLDPFIFGKKAPEGLFAEVVNAPEAYYVLYIHSPAKEMSVKEYGDENPRARTPYITKYIEKNIEMLVSYQNGAYKAKDKDIQAADITENTPIVKFWGKSYAAGQLARYLAAINGQGTVTPQPTDLVQLLASAEAGHRTRLAILLKTYKGGAASGKDYTEATNQLVTRMDSQNMQQIIQGYVMAQVNTNVKPADVSNYYNTMPQKPIKSYTDAGQPVYATLAESSETLKQEIVNGRIQQIYLDFLSKANATYKLTWNEANIEVFKAAFNAEYAKLAKTLPQK